MNMSLAPLGLQSVVADVAPALLPRRVVGYCQASARKVVTGTPAMREALRTFISGKPTLTLDVKTLTRTGDIALTCGRWALISPGPHGLSVTTCGRSMMETRLRIPF
jgi:hypothetical protein